MKMNWTPEGQPIEVVIISHGHWMQCAFNESLPEWDKCADGDCIENTSQAWKLAPGVWKLLVQPMVDIEFDNDGYDINGATYKLLSKEQVYAYPTSPDQGQSEPQGLTLPPFDELTERLR